MSEEDFPVLVSKYFLYQCYPLARHGIIKSCNSEVIGYQWEIKMVELHFNSTADGRWETLSNTDMIIWSAEYLEIINYLMYNS